MEHLHPYVPIAIIMLVAFAFGVISLVMGRLIGPRRPNPNKDLPYESGIVPTGEANVRLPIKFYMVALLFLLFDMEAVYILAWAVVFQGKGIDFASPSIGFTQPEFMRFAFLEMFVFVVILMVGYLYVWRKGGLKWS